MRAMVIFFPCCLESPLQTAFTECIISALVLGCIERDQRKHKKEEKPTIISQEHNVNMQINVKERNKNTICPLTHIK